MVFLDAKVFISMEHLIHRAPSVGGVIKKIMAINPDLNVREVIDLVRRSTETQVMGGEFSKAEIVNEAKALELARATVKN